MGTHNLANSAPWCRLYRKRRAALGHWAAIRDGKIDLYQCVVPTTWVTPARAIPRQIGAYEAALMNTKMAIPEQPLEDPAYSAQL